METLDISKLSAEQLKQIKQQLNASRKSLANGRPERYAIIDKMLQEREGEHFKNTTSDILVAMQNEPNCLVPATLNDGDRAEWIKKIQTRKQHLEKQANEDGTLKYAKGTFGYKPSAGGFNLTPDRVVDWLMDEANIAKLTKADKAAILKAVK